MQNDPQNESELPEVRISDVTPDPYALSEDDRQAMENLIIEGIPRFPEHLFVKYLLPLTFAQGSGEVVVQEWRRIVGSVTTDIIVTTSSGEEYTVPGLYPEMPTFAERTGKSMSWAELSNMTIIDNSIHPSLGEERLVELGSRALPTLTREEHQAHRERWVKIWTRHGVNGFAGTPEADTPAADAGRARLDELDEEDDV